MILARCVRHSGSQLDHLPRIILSACHLSRARWIIAVNAASQTFATNVNNSIPSHKHQLDNPHHTNASLNAMLSTACCAKPSQPAPNATKNSPSSHRERYAIVPPISSLIMAPASALREPNNMRISALCARLITALLAMRWIAVCSARTLINYKIILVHALKPILRIAVPAYVQMTSSPTSPLMTNSAWCVMCKIAFTAPLRIFAVNVPTIFNYRAITAAFAQRPIYRLNSNAYAPITTNKTHPKMCVLSVRSIIVFIARRQIFVKSV